MAQDNPALLINLWPISIISISSNSMPMNAVPPDTGVQGDAPSVPMMQSASCMIHRHVRTPLSMSAGSVLACRCEADLGHGWVTSEFWSQRVSRFRVKSAYNSF